MDWTLEEVEAVVSNYLEMLRLEISGIEAKKSERKNGSHSGAARKTAKGNTQGERGGVHQFGVPPKGNSNFA